MQKIFNRIKRILFQPNTTWEEIKAEATTEKEIFQGYLVFIAAVPAVAGFLGSLFEGENFFRALLWAVLFFGFSVAAVWASAKVLTFFAPNFKADQNYLATLQLTTNTFTPIFLACIFFLIPPIYGFSILGIYGFYLFWIGVPKLINCPQEELFNFRFIGIIVIAIAILVIFILSALISGTSVYYLSI
ncbi:MAG: YIP1 family protein [bacterium]|nr:MAG: YIP1 family protein [bacterium]